MIFDDRIASDLSEFTGEVDADGDLNWSADAGCGVSSGGIALTLDDTNAMYVYEFGYASATGRFRVRVYFDPNSQACGSGNQVNILAIRSNAGNNCGLFDVIKTGSTWYAFPRIYNDAAGVAGPTPVSISDDVHYVEIEWVRAANSTSNDGRMDWWIDGSAQTSTTGIDNYDRFSDTNNTRYGAITFSGAPTGTMYLGPIAATDDGSTIGPVAAGGVTIPVFMAQYRQRRR